MDRDLKLYHLEPPLALATSRLLFLALPNVKDYAKWRAVWLVDPSNQFFQHGYFPIGDWGTESYRRTEAGRIEQHRVLGFGHGVLATLLMQGVHIPGMRLIFSMVVMSAIGDIIRFSHL